MQTKYPRTANVNIRVNPQVKEDAEAVLDEIGLNLSDVFNLLLNQIRLTRCIPFQLQSEEIDIDPKFYPQILETLNKAEEDRKNGIDDYYTVDEVIASMDKIIEEAEKNEKKI